MKIIRRILPLTMLALPLAAIGVVWANRIAIGDWFQLQAYDPPQAIARLADTTTMTERARHLFYVNHPQLEGRDGFNRHCTNRTEQSVVLGCYKGDRGGIFLFDVKNDELHGVEEVTAAHEMLHQAYDRLTQTDRTRINTLLQDFNDTQLDDETIKSQIANYMKTEPDAVVNEMHSLFGTQVVELPQELEQYYSQYFSNRKSIATLYNKYQAAFTNRTKQIESYDKQLVTQKETVDILESDLESQLSKLDSEKRRLDGLRTSGDIAAYNQFVSTYNSLVDAYNADLGVLREKVKTYNALVEQRNSIALQEQQLQQDLSSQKLPSFSGQ